MSESVSQEEVDAAILSAAQAAPTTPAAEVPICTVARTYFDLREYERAAHTLRSCDDDLPVFMRNYALYLAGEGKKEDGNSDLLAPLVESAAVNESLPKIRSELSARREAGRLDVYGHYLLGLVFSAQGLKVEATECYTAAIKLDPTFWGAWYELAALCASLTEAQDFDASNLPVDHWIKHFYNAHVALELHHSDRALELYHELDQLYPGSTYIQAQIATAHYNRREFETSEEIFQRLRKIDPYRLDDVDTYSNILYVKEAKTELSFLAHEAMSHGQYRAETCCVIGNYYSLKNRHEKAVVYFQRALKLNRAYLSAWTLMGHEYVELKNSPAAIEAYRRAVEINPRDYRAWYGLGQTYELLKMPLYSLHYYRQSQRLRPYDARMWSALAHTYRELSRWLEAAKCYERAIGLNQSDATSTYELATLYKNRIANGEPQAAKYFEHVLNIHEEDGSTEETEQTVDACTFLAEYFKAHGDPDRAEPYALRLMNVGGKHKETAKSLLGTLSTPQGSSPGLGSSIDLPSPGDPDTPSWF